MQHTPLESYIIFNEGWRNRRYMDSLGIATIGVGFNLTCQDAHQRITALDVDYYSLLAGTTELTDDQVETLLRQDVATVLSDVSVIFGSYSTFSPGRQIAIADMRFQLGAGGIREFRMMISAINAGQWSEAADQALSSEYAKQTPNRAQRDATALRTGDLPSGVSAPQSPC